ncbi:hypothetical protein E4U42_000083 [Claviceps africana]|uniref:Zinc transporter n=1 Tax=Claviceps africana TaxID=83212 RepID=A0A8K0NIJ7_9HYPO|nr:hypothetical protein E4U42_000083 [Claviceps africana]
MHLPLIATLALIHVASAQLIPGRTAAPTTAAPTTAAPTTAASTTTASDSDSASVSATASVPAPAIAAVTGCHLHESQLICMGPGETEYIVQTTPTQTAGLPASYTDCHNHGAELFCVAPNGDDVQVSLPNPPGSAGGRIGGKETGSSHKHCHFHAGVEHCVGDGEKSRDGPPECGVPKRDYNVRLRVGLLFVIMATSALGVFAPIFLHNIFPKKFPLLFTILKQFGTGIIISTAFVHLLVHASLMFANKCLGNLAYEGTPAAILMAGIFLSFLVEYLGQRIVLARKKATSSLGQEQQAQALLSNQVVGILVMEAGILFHSLLIGLTLVVAGDSFFLTLFVVILFHQMFEGLALGTRIATIGAPADRQLLSNSDPLNRGASNGTDKSGGAPVDETTNRSSDLNTQPLSLTLSKKLSLAALFAFVTPVGMAIGIGVLDHFNGNDKSTIIAIGTLDALSAGILVWTGIVEMWAADWMTGSHGHKAELADADTLTVVLGGAGLMTGMALMSLLGKWA